MKSAIAVAGVLMVVVSYQTVTFAQQCPPEFAQAKAKIASTQAAMKKSTAQGKEVQAPRTAAGYKGQEQQAPRGQEQQAPRGQEPQAPRKAAGARSQTAMQSNLARARKLTAESEQACKAGDMSLSAQKAKAALEALK